MTYADLLAKWEQRRAEWRGLGVQVNGTAIADELLADLHALSQANALEELTLREAALLSGYSVDHLQRLVSSGQLENVGRKGRPRVRRGDLPVKPGHRLPSTEPESQFAARRRIVASVAKSGEAS
ncbi:MAG: hypothetical protein JWM95_3941 [Gemmatimonadetes bacterium]|nr:hypothetical protein [Gemmatimonadota bacterium]